MTPEYKSWARMKNRCYNKGNKSYKNYGGRGIKVCERWVNSASNFISDMGPKPSRFHSVERVNNNGDYEPTNCKWATRYEQSRNRTDSFKITFNGETKTITDWANQIGMKRTSLRNRIASGWPLEKALNPSARNKRMVLFGGSLKSVREWSKQLGINEMTLHSRLNDKWSIEKALTTPTAKRTWKQSNH